MNDPGRTAGEDLDVSLSLAINATMVLSSVDGGSVSMPLSAWCCLIRDAAVARGYLLAPVCDDAPTDRDGEP